MDLVISDIDEVLSTTRAVRRRLDLTRPVPDDVILECIDLAEQSPTGGNQSSRRWILITQPALKQEIADLYRRTVGQWLIDTAEKLKGTGHHREKTTASSAHLAQTLQDVPALVVLTIHGEHDGSGRPGLFDSVIQAGWSFCLALRARGLGTTWTTGWMMEQERMAELLAIPEGVTQIVLFPVAYTKGTEFQRAPRRPAREITWRDGWGFTTERTPTGRPLMADGPGVVVEADIDARPEKVWPVITDLNAPAAFSEEFNGADWLDEPGLGARFVGRNALGQRQWEVESTVVAWEPEHCFAWHVQDVDDPGARWKFELEPIVGGTRLRFSVVLGPGRSGLTDAISHNVDAEADIVAGRCDWHRKNMTATVEGLKALAEAAG